MIGQIPILRLNVRGGHHVVERLDCPYDTWNVIRTFGTTIDEYRKAILYLNETRKQLESRKKTDYDKQGITTYVEQ